MIASLSMRKGIFKTVDTGKTWRFVYDGELVGHLAESDGLLLTTTMGKIIRSTDKGKTWELMVPSVAGKVFSLYGSGGSIYAVTSKPG